PLSHLLCPHPPVAHLFPSTTLFRSPLRARSLGEEYHAREQHALLRTWHADEIDRREAELAQPRARHMTAPATQIDRPVENDVGELERFTDRGRALEPKLIDLGRPRRMPAIEEPRQHAADAARHAP